MNFIAEERTCLVVYPAQPSSIRRNAGIGSAAHQRRDEGEPSLIAGITRQMRDRSIDPKRASSRACRRAAPPRRHGGRLRRSLRGGRDPFRPRLWSRHRYALGIHSHAARRQRPSSNCGGGPMMPTIVPTIVGRWVMSLVVHRTKDWRTGNRPRSGSALQTSLGLDPTAVFKTVETPPQRIFSSRLDTGGRPCLLREWLARPRWLPAMPWLRGILCTPRQRLEFSSACPG